MSCQKARRKDVLRKKLGSDMGEEQDRPRKKGKQTGEDDQEGGRATDSWLAG